jgi:hypothetical protein
VIELQPSRKSRPEEISFVINFGVIVPGLFVGEDLTKPEYGGCHWGGRVSGKDSVEIDRRCGRVITGTARVLLRSARILAADCRNV